MSATSANSSVSVSSIRIALRIVPRLTSRLLPSRPLRKAAALRSSFTKQTILSRVTTDGVSSGGLTIATLALIAVFLGNFEGVVYSLPLSAHYRVVLTGDFGGRTAANPRAGFRGIVLL